MTHDDSPSASPSASRWLARALRLATPGAPAVDIACGSGRGARALIAAGHPTLAVDRDLSRAPRDLPGLALLEADLETGDWPLAGRAFGVVVVMNYLWRPRFDAVLALLAPGGVLVWETFAQGNERFGKPSNPDFLLAPNELINRCAPTLTVLAYTHGIERTPRPALRQKIIARREAADEAPDEARGA